MLMVLPGADPETRGGGGGGHGIGKLHIYYQWHMRVVIIGGGGLNW